jgi:hypothetical protein
MQADGIFTSRFTIACGFQGKPTQKFAQEGFLIWVFDQPKIRILHLLSKTSCRMNHGNCEWHFMVLFWMFPATMHREKRRFES